MGILTQDELDRQVELLEGYLSKPNNRGIDFWLNSKDFSKEERNYLRASFGGSDED